MEHTEVRPLTVGELTRAIRLTLEAGFDDLWVVGEVSNFRQHGNGHWYFTLKDAEAALECVVWRQRTSYMPFRPEDGMQVRAHGGITVYERQGRYQLDVDRLQADGIGALQRAFELLKARLHAEGLFSKARQPLPPFPRRIGIVTSPTGAALQDMLRILRRRFPLVEVLVYPARVQGVGAADEIAAGIAYFNRCEPVDVLIVGRGGGSAEDLWAFNEEVVVRAVFGSRIPVVSAVGHEIDITLCDLAADVRAATPSNAAELVVPDQVELRDRLLRQAQRLEATLRAMLRWQRERLGALRNRHGLRRALDLLRERERWLSDLAERLARAIAWRLERERAHLEQLRMRLAAQRPTVPLERGFALVWHDGHLIHQARELTAGDRIELEFYDGRLPARIEGRSA
ncbi:MAG: exodeoxyribonuclease VII large subunit [Bacteroidetes bacterium]|nr:exodeoxyribonuclease VII large subunit [Rhodothermia bacterium]MCS7154719.1 exodeoxyribonuclease VII large subunit [Bacteroidota bacterium]MCX7907124.1 exodeoxyribonuclease VII large subunit [Bacteroidota bacterium]MDW8137512.1 exodeoxyribonuclease VII large subunit [Bacteroidota bacterium]MDW8285534.1 exodeoxyribonuclease VII large subunit [Bacteroidota bacterium]